MKNNKQKTMKNKASELFDGLPHDEEEFKIVIEKKRNKFNIHICLEGVIEKSFLGVKHWHVNSPFGDDAE
jgi:hypothetical protein